MKTYAKNFTVSQPKAISYARPGDRLSDDFILKLINEQRRATQSARVANERRYQDILKGYDNRYSGTMAQINRIGDAGREDILQRGAKAKLAAGADLVNRGLTGTTVKPAMNLGYEREINSALVSYDESVARQRADAEANLQGDKLSFMERREDSYPADISGLLMQLGQSSVPVPQPVSYAPSARVSPTLTQKPVKQNTSVVSNNNQIKALLSLLASTSASSKAKFPATYASTAKATSKTPGTPAVNLPPRSKQAFNAGYASKMAEISGGYGVPRDSTYKRMTYDF